MHCKEQRRIISEICMFIFQSKFNNPPYHDRVTEKSGTSKINQWDFQISKVGSLDFLNLKVNGSPVIRYANISFLTPVLMYPAGIDMSRPIPMSTTANVFMMIDQLVMYWHVNAKPLKFLKSVRWCLVKKSQILINYNTCLSFIS